MQTFFLNIFITCVIHLDGVLTLINDIKTKGAFRQCTTAATIVSNVNNTTEVGGSSRLS